MKKNKVRRLASVLLVLTLLTTSIISGTFAKYTTTDEGSDTARVAKFGVVATVSGGLFGDYYYTKNDTNGNNPNEISVTTNASTAGTNSVENSAVSENDVVAPGTQNTANGLTISVTGTPKVSTNVKITSDTTSNSTYSDIWLLNGSYAVMKDVTTTVTADNFTDYYVRTGNPDAYTYTKATGTYDSSALSGIYYEMVDGVTLSSSEYPTSQDARYVYETTAGGAEEGHYYPIVWTVTPSTGSEVGNIHTVGDLTAQLALYGAINGSLITYAPNTDLSSANGFGSYVITWEWPFEILNGTVADETVDGCDTILGDLIAYDSTTSNYQVVQITDTGNICGISVDTTSDVKTATVDGTKVACLTVGFNATVTVTQVD
ncbi:MAG: hypothetical protein LUC83_01195 [Clostridiales bacterium]|nr:hypothetical protein [Clostridiales bacterium]